MDIMMDYQQRKAALEERLTSLKEEGGSYNLARGNPGPEQLDLSLSLLDTVSSASFFQDTTMDIRNYGPVDGLPEAKALFAQYMGVGIDEIIVGGNSSLNMMHDLMRICLLNGTTQSTPWAWEKPPKFLCPSPGYDRHFTICQSMGIEMVPVEMKQDGPNLDQVEALASKDESIKGIWCVPKFSNPTGVCYSSAVVDRLAAIHAAAKDFRIFWDNAYAFHDFSTESINVDNLLTACKRSGNSDRAFMFGSTSKLTFPGAAVAFFASSTKNIKFVKEQLAYQTIGSDKINQLRQVQFFQSIDGIQRHAQKHGAILKKKFDIVNSALHQHLGDKNLAEWDAPKGGYFISLNTLPGCATKVVNLAKEIGLTLMPAGSTFPYRQDPYDQNIRLAPSASTLEQLPIAAEILCCCIEYVTMDNTVNQS